MVSKDCTKDVSLNELDQLRKITVPKVFTNPLNQNDMVALWYRQGMYCKSLALNNHFEIGILQPIPSSTC